MRKRKYNQGGTIGSAVGTVAGGAIGSVVPVLGTAVGASIGGAVGGGIGNLIGKNTAEAQAHILPANQTVIPEQYLYNQTLSTNPYGNSVAYAMGGPLNITNYQGPTHEQGGIALGNSGNEVEGGEVKVGNFVFSNRLTVDGKQTFADVAKGIQVKYKGKTDNITLRTMNRELEQLAQRQEQMKQQAQQVQQAQQGIVQGDQQVQAMQQGVPQQQMSQVPQQPTQSPIQGTQPVQQQTQPQQYANGGTVNSDGGPGWWDRFVNGNWGVGDYGKYHAKYNNNDGAKDDVINMIGQNDKDFKNFTVPGKQTWADKQFRSSYAVGSYGNPYAGNGGTALKVSLGVPIAGGKNPDGSKRQTVKPTFGINPAFYVMPGTKNADGNFYQQHVAGQYVPNLFKKDPTGLGVLGWDKNNIGSKIWGTSPTQSNYNFTGLKPIQPVQSDYNLLGTQQGTTDQTQHAMGGLLNNTRKFSLGGLNNPDDPPHTYTDYELNSFIVSHPDIVDYMKKQTGNDYGSTRGISDIARNNNGTDNYPNFYRALYSYMDQHTANRANKSFNKNSGTGIPNRHSTTQSNAQTNSNTGTSTQSNTTTSNTSATTSTSTSTNPTQSTDNDQSINSLIRPATKLLSFNLSPSELSPQSQTLSATITDNSNIFDRFKDAAGNIDWNALRIKFPNIDLSKFKLPHINLPRLGDVAKVGLSTLGGLYDIARGSTGGDFESYGRLNPLTLQQMDPTRAIQNQREIGQNAATDIANIGGQGLGQYLSNRGSVANNTQRNVANTVAQYDNANMGVLNQQAQLNSGIQAQNLQMDIAQNEINAKERDAAQNDIQHGLTTLSQGINQGYQDKAQKDVQEQMLKNWINTNDLMPIPSTDGNTQGYGLKHQYNGTTYIIDAADNNTIYDLSGTVVGRVNDGFFSNDQSIGLQQTTLNAFGGPLRMRMK